MISERLNMMLHVMNTETRRLTVSGDFVGRVESPVAARRGADIHVEVDVVSQPEAALLVPHEYGLVPVFRAFTVVRKRKINNKNEGD